MKCINRKKFIQYDCSFKGKLLELRREVCMDKHGKKDHIIFSQLDADFSGKNMYLSDLPVWIYALIMRLAER